MKREVSANRPRLMNLSKSQLDIADTIVIFFQIDFAKQKQIEECGLCKSSLVVMLEVCLAKSILKQLLL